MEQVCQNLSKDENGDYLDNITLEVIPYNRIISITHPNGAKFCYDSLSLIQWYVSENLQTNGFYKEVKDPSGSGYDIPQIKIDEAVKNYYDSLENYFFVRDFVTKRSQIDVIKKVVDLYSIDSIDNIDIIMSKIQPYYELKELIPFLDTSFKTTRDNLMGVLMSINNVKEFDRLTEAGWKVSFESIEAYTAANLNSLTTKNAFELFDQDMSSAFEVEEIPNLIEYIYDNNERMLEHHKDKIMPMLIRSFKLDDLTFLINEKGWVLSPSNAKSSIIEMVQLGEYITEMKVVLPLISKLKNEIDVLCYSDLIQAFIKQSDDLPYAVNILIKNGFSDSILSSFKYYGLEISYEELKFLVKKLEDFVSDIPFEKLDIYGINYIAEKYGTGTIDIDNYLFFGNSKTMEILYSKGHKFVYNNVIVVLRSGNDEALGKILDLTYIKLEEEDVDNYYSENPQVDMISYLNSIGFRYS